MNWGYSIAVAFAFFMAFIIYLVVGTYKQNVDLVFDDYYVREIKFQEQIDKSVNAADKPLKWSVRNDSVVVKFPESVDFQTLSGEIVFYRPDHSGSDIKERIFPGTSGEQVFPVSKFRQGKYRLKTDWQSGGNNYYDEQIIVL
ncbi:FixH family protein [Cytophagaceae bacterium ABcell3]|nr:FixH family protein [Cytophagaceae bacterium ABcell3]